LTKCYLSRVDHDRKIRSRKHSIVNRAMQLRNQTAYLTDQEHFEQTARRIVVGRVNNWPNSPTTTDDDEIFHTKCIVIFILNAIAVSIFHQLPPSTCCNGNSLRLVFGM
jgi:hypothetical protein